MDGLHLGGQLAKDQLLPLQSSSSTSLLQQTQQLQQLAQSQSQSQPQSHQPHLLLQARTGSQSLLRTSRSPSATRSTEQSESFFFNKISIKQLQKKNVEFICIF